MHRILQFDENDIARINTFFADAHNRVLPDLFNVIEKYGSIDQINQQAEEATKLENKLKNLSAINSPYLKDIEWLIQQRDKKAFISLDDYTKKVLGDKYSHVTLDKEHAVTLEISALQFFPWFVQQARQAIAQGELMPGRFIRVRNMKEQEADSGDLIATTAAMGILGATWVETLDTRGTDGANVHLGGPDTITGYFGGPGEPNEYALKWVDEYLYYHTRYGVKEVLCINPGTVLLGYMLYKLGINIEFKISVFMGNDNPYSILWTLMTARLFSRKDGTTPLIGFNFSNSVNNETIEISDIIRKGLGFDGLIRFDHHITEAYKSIVRQPYDRTDELAEVAKNVKGISAKHEGGKQEVEQKRQHQSDILDYFRSKEEIEQNGLMPAMLQNYLDKHSALNCTAKCLIEHGISVIPAPKLHK